MGTLSFVRMSDAKPPSCQLRGVMHRDGMKKKVGMAARVVRIE